MEWMLMPYRRYAEFSGRSRRKEYWMFALFMFLVYAVGIALVLAGGGMQAMMAGTIPEPDAVSPAEVPGIGPLGWVGIALMVIFALGSFIPSIAVTVRRFHDRDMSGWWYLGFVVAGAIPFVGSLVSIGLLVLMCLPGTPGTNRFGDDPKNPVGYDVFG